MAELRYNWYSMAISSAVSGMCLLSTLISAPSSHPSQPMSSVSASGCHCCLCLAAVVPGPSVLAGTCGLVQRAEGGKRPTTGGSTRRRLSSYTTRLAALPPDPLPSLLFPPQESSSTNASRSFLLPHPFLFNNIFNPRSLFFFTFDRFFNNPTI